MPLVLSDDFGKDVSTAEGLLIRHEKLEDEVIYLFLFFMIFVFY
jgi:hypothetical protein